MLAQDWALVLVMLARDWPLFLVMSVLLLRVQLAQGWALALLLLHVLRQGGTSDGSPDNPSLDTLYTAGRAPSAHSRSTRPNPIASRRRICERDTGGATAMVASWEGVVVALFRPKQLQMYHRRRRSLDGDGIGGGGAQDVTCAFAMRFRRRHADGDDYDDDYYDDG